MRGGLQLLTVHRQCHVIDDAVPRKECGRCIITPSVHVPFDSLSKVPNLTIYTEPYSAGPTLVRFASNDGDWNADSGNSAVDCGDASSQVSVHRIPYLVYELEDRVTGHVYLSFVVAEQVIEPAHVLYSMSRADSGRWMCITARGAVGAYDTAATHLWRR